MYIYMEEIILFALWIIWNNIEAWYSIIPTLSAYKIKLCNFFNMNSQVKCG